VPDARYADDAVVAAGGDHLARALPGLLDGDDAVLEQVGRSPVAQAAGAARTPISARPWPAWALPM